MSGEIINLLGAISFAKGINDTLDLEIQHANASLAVAEGSINRAKVVAAYLEDLAATMKRHGYENGRETEALINARNFATSLIALREPLETYVGELAANIELNNVLIKQMQDIAEKK